MARLRRGTRLGKYRLDRRLGVGATAEVWAARDTVQDRRVAVKVVLPEIVEQFGCRAIENEARLAARLEHPNIVAVRNADWVGAHFLIVTDIANRTLEDYASVRRSSTLALRIVRDVAAGLAYAHARHVLHRDVKPANILIFSGRNARLADFGTARFAPARTRLLTEVGTPGFMAPEQAYGRPRYASDVFSLGLIAYRLLTGVLPSWPFTWPLEGHMTFKRRTPAEVQTVLRRALEVPLERRWRDAGEFERALDRASQQASRRQRQKALRRKASSRTPSTPFELETRWFRREYGRRLDLRFDCFSCGGPIAEPMKHCPWCGTDRNSFIEVTRYPLVCPECERGVRPEWSACPWCFAGRFEPDGRRPPRDRLAARRCRRSGCQGLLRPFMRYCPLCKTKVSRPWRESGLRACPRCAWPLAPRWRFCAWCGRRERSALSVSRASR